MSLRKMLGRCSILILPIFLIGCVDISNCSIDKVSFDAQTNQLCWRLNNQEDSLIFVLERKKWGKWFPNDTLDSTCAEISPTEGYNEYKISVLNMVGCGKEYSFIVFPEGKLYYMMNDSLYVDKQRSVGIYDYNGNQVYKDSTNRVALKEFKQGLYYLNVDSVSYEIRIHYE